MRKMNEVLYIIPNCGATEHRYDNTTFENHCSKYDIQQSNKQIFLYKLTT